VAALGIDVLERKAAVRTFTGSVSVHARAGWSAVMPEHET
jgi:hypothetical protein